MKKSLMLCLLIAGVSSVSYAQRSCGWSQQLNKRIAQDPTFLETYQKNTQSLSQRAADYYEQIANNQETANKTTAISPIPVIFHVIVSTAQLAAIGGEAGIKARCDSQIAVLNRDFNRQNSDSTLIPSGWKPLYRSVGVRFGLAHTNPSGGSTPGYEFKINATGFVEGADGDYGDAKSLATGGFDAWNTDRYMNIYCIYFRDNTSLLGVTTPPSFATGSFGSMPTSRRGICVAYNAWGKRRTTSENFAGGGVYDLGRTLTHEMGHYFDMRQTWGDDGGACPWSGGYDDGIGDTPPESDAAYGNPAYTITGGTLYDGSNFNSTGMLMQSIGIPCLNYMDYTDDRAMRMFTAQQAGAMANQVLIASGSSYTLTQNGTLLNYPTSVQEVNAQVAVNIHPNPTNGEIQLTYNNTSNNLRKVVITNIVGKTVAIYDAIENNEGVYKINLEGYSKGMYLVNCTFTEGIATQKIVLE
jgi:hypothetical protein